MRQVNNARRWYWDAVASFAFYGQAIFLGKAMAKVHPIIGLLFFLVNFGLGYYYGRAAWRGLIDARNDPH